MPKSIYNEGRVVGYSTYELYLKHALAENPEIEPASEREWLAAQIAHGASMLLKVPVDSTTGVHYVDFPLPENSRLCSANTIVASQFFGDCVVDSHNWAIRVTDYGQGISNTSSKYPSDTEDATTYPAQAIAEFDATQKKQFLQYVKIQDGVILQPGGWREADNKPPYRDFTPNLTEVPVLRLTFASKVTTSFYILFTGFTDNSILAGISGIDSGSTSHEHPENGDFLGPEIYPWANKITFTYPAIASYYLRKYFAIGSIPSEVTTYLTKYDNTKPITKKNARIDYDEDSIDTIWNTSYIVPDKGISVYGPNSDAGMIVIGAKMGTANNSNSSVSSRYIKITQADGGYTADDAQPTTLTPSYLVPFDGVAITDPTVAGGDINISNRIDVDSNKCLAVIQTANTSKAGSLNSSSLGSARTNNAVRTVLKASKPVAGNGVTVGDISTYGADITISAPMSVDSTRTNYLSITQTAGGTTVFKPASISGSDYIGITVTNGDVEVTLDASKLTNTLKDTFVTLDDFKNVFDTLLAKIGDGNSKLGSNLSSNSPISWGSMESDSGTKLAVGNLNVHSSSNRSIRCHAGDEDGDVKWN